jgi:hypothetical protein
MSSVNEKNKISTSLSEHYDSSYSFSSISSYFTSSSSTSSYIQHYSIYNSALVIPLYLIIFSYNDNKEDDNKLIVCSFCNNKQASVFCVNDDAYLCSDCGFFFSNLFF